MSNAQRVASRTNKTIRTQLLMDALCLYSCSDGLSFDYLCMRTLVDSLAPLDTVQDTLRAYYAAAGSAQFAPTLPSLKRWREYKRELAAYEAATTQLEREARPQEARRLFAALGARWRE